MIIIAGHILVESSEREAYVDAHRDLVERARAFDGCLDVAITADSVDTCRVNNVEIWRDADALDSWKARPTLPTWNRFVAHGGLPGEAVRVGEGSGVATEVSCRSDLVRTAVGRVRCS